MGGCVASCMSSSNAKAEVPNPHAQRTRSIKHFSVPVPADEENPKAPNESLVYRSPSQANLKFKEWYGKYYGGEWGSLPQLLKANCEKYGPKPAIAWRPVEKIVKEDVDQPDGSKKQLEVTYYAPTVRKSYAELWTSCVGFSNGLRELGLGANSHVGLYEETRAEWLQACYGIWLADMIGVTVYANLGEDALIYAMKEAELTAVLVNGKQVGKLRALCTAAGVAVPIMIYTDTLPAGTDTTNVFSFEEVVKKGEGKPALDFHRDPSKTSLIMYTSGTTGDPKGVVMSHGNLIAAIMAYLNRLEDALNVPEVPSDKDKEPKKKDQTPKQEEDEVYVGYLPLAHSLEFAAENVMLTRGVMIGYGNPRTLTSTAAKPHGDLEEFKPSFFAGVPRIFDTIKKGVLAKLPKDGVKRVVFDRAFEDRKKAMESGQETPYWNEKVFANTKVALGGRVKAIASGAAPLSEQTQTFMEVVFGVSVLQGYGLTETCACCSLQRMYDPKKESIGGLVSVAEVKLRDADLWKHTDAPCPRGELLIRGPIVTQGYYKQPEKTAEAWTNDQWFCTGDVAEITADGTLKIIGRTKALVKNVLGEYVALEALEATYVQNDLVLPNGVCVLVNQQRAYICAIVLTDEAKATKFAADHKISGKFPEMLSTPEFRQKAAESLAATAKKFNRKPFECVKDVRVLAEEWTPDNGVLTAAMKLKRRVIDEKYADMINEMFAKES